MSARDSGSKRRGEPGFAYLVLAIALAALGVLLVMAVPESSGRIDSGRRADVRAELQSVKSALEAWFFDHAGFPASLTANDFFAVYLQPRLGGTATVDAWSNRAYRYSIDNSAHTATVYSTDADGVDNGAANEALVVVANGTMAGQTRTSQRLRVVAMTVQRYLAGGGRLTGDWQQDRVTLGMGSEYATDGFGQPLLPVYQTGEGGAGGAGDHGQQHDGHGQGGGDRHDGTQDENERGSGGKGDHEDDGHGEDHRTAAGCDAASTRVDVAEVTA